MRRTLLPLLALTLAGPAQAQSPHWGFGLVLTNPTGSFSQTKYPPYYDSALGRTIPTQTEGYDMGVGGYFNMSFPLDRNAAIRLTFGGSSEDGSNTAPGEQRINLRHSTFSIGTDLQLFLQGGALRHSGTYLFAGVAADFERFDRGYGSLDYYYDYYNDAISTERKSRMAGNVGFGHSFGQSLKFNLEVSYHATLTGKKDTDPPASDYVRLGFGVVF